MTLETRRTLDGRVAEKELISPSKHFVELDGVRLHAVARARGAARRRVSLVEQASICIIATRVRFPSRNFRVSANIRALHFLRASRRVAILVLR